MAAQTTYVSNEVWRQLPQRRLPRGRAVTAVVALLALAAAIGIGQLIGLFKPRFNVQTPSWGAQQGSHRFTQGLMLQNEGWFPTTLSTVAVTAPWLHLTSVTIDSLNTHGERGPGNVITLKPGDTVSYTLEFTVPNCTEIDKSGASVAVTAQGPLWTRTVNVRPPGTSDAGALSNQGWTVNPPELSWPVEAADLACKPVTAK